MQKGTKKPKAKATGADAQAAASNIQPGVKKVAGAPVESGLVIQNILVRPVQRGLLDIQKWRTNWQTAEGYSNLRVPLYDMYDDCLADGFLKRLVAKRVLGVTKNKIKYVDADGVEVEEAKSFLKKRQFRKLRQYIQLQKAWGISVIELINENGNFRCFDVPKKHIQPVDGLITEEQYNIETGTPYREAPYNRTVLEIGDWDDLGYLLQACAYVIYKRGVIGDWANFAQIFGMPMRIGRYDGFNETVRLQLENALAAAGSAAYMVLPKESEIEILESKSTQGSSQLYDSLRKAMNEELTVLIIGATETTTSSASSGYAQSETHLKTVDEQADDDKEDELCILNEQALNILIYLGLLPAGGSFMYDEPIDIEDANDRVDLLIKMKNAGVPVDDDEFYTASGVSKPKDYDAQKQQMASDKAAEQAAKGTQPTNFPTNKPKGQKKPQKLSAEQQAVYDKLAEKLNDFFA